MRPFSPLCVILHYLSPLCSLRHLLCKYHPPQRGRLLLQDPKKRLPLGELPTGSGETAFVRKEYLSKVLLDYVLGLELLPEIHNLEEKTDCKKK